mgnify:FL=1
MAKLPMVMKNGKKVPAYAADGVGKMNKGGSVKDKAEAKMFLGGIVSSSARKAGKLAGGLLKKVKAKDKITAGNKTSKPSPKPKAQTPGKSRSKPKIVGEPYKVPKGSRLEDFLKRNPKSKPKSPKKPSKPRGPKTPMRPLRPRKVKPATPSRKSPKR